MLPRTANRKKKVFVRARFCCRRHPPMEVRRREIDESTSFYLMRNQRYIMNAVTSGILYQTQ